MSNKQALDALEMLKKMFEPETGYGLEQIATIKKTLTAEVDIKALKKEVWGKLCKLRHRNHQEVSDDCIEILASKEMIHPVEQPTGYKLMLDYFRAKEEYLSRPGSENSISTPEGRKLNKKAGELFNIALDHLNTGL